MENPAASMSTPPITPAAAQPSDMPIMATPVNADYELDLVSQRRQVEYCIQCGAVAVGHFAYASEFRKISDTDRSRLLDVVVEQVNGRIPFFAGITGKTRSDMLRYAREAEQRGAESPRSSTSL
mgnify:CR=1 FL=1